MSNKYISSIERSTLIAASRILERLATAAERAKKEKKRIENEEEQRRRNRESQASRLLFERYANGSLNTRETAITMEAFCRLNNNPSRLEKRDIEDAITYCHRYNKKVVEVITARINMGLKEELLRMASDIAWRDPEVDELVGVVCDNFEAMIGKVEMEKKAVLDRLDEVIAIYQSEQVIPLNPRKAIDNYSR